ncbi:FAD binding domain-containing protein [Lentinula lateritia]|uniref:FAD binding domain-containing protein n=1 Tax=Lentinula lateritia TaxID=40482 RepID=A0ABQ8UYX4_9AGAR|nr:FAD binding domain-containing protein [Lentinula lateritia]
MPLSPTSVSPSVLVVGAGPVGSVLALTLLKNGIPVRIIDKAGPQIGQKGAGIQPRSLEMHHFLGTLPDFLDVGKALPPCTVYKLPGGTEILKTFEMIPYEEPRPDIPYINAVMLGQHRKQSILHRHLEKYGCEVEFHTELRSFKQYDDHVLATIIKRSSDGTEVSEEIKVPYVVGADGAHSTIRRTLGLTFLGDTRDDVNMVIGDIEVKGGLDRKSWHLWGGGSAKMVTLIPTEVDDNIFTMIIAGNEIDHAKTVSGRDELVKTITSITDRNDIEFGDLVWMSRYRPNIRMVNKFGEGRVFVAGDAAHVHSPTGGQGTNSGVQDSFNLGWKLALVLKGFSPASFLDTYTEERLPVIAAMLDKSTFLLNRGLEKPRSDNSNWTRGAEFKQLGINYRGSSTLVDETTDLTKDLIRSDSYSLASDGVVHAGDRAPEAPGLEVLHSNGNFTTMTSLFDIFKPDHHTVLIFSYLRSKAEETASEFSAYAKSLVQTVLILPALSQSEQIASGQQFGVDLVLRDGGGHAYKGYPAPPGSCTVVVVRPDGIIGAIAGGVDGLRQYLSGVFLAPK